MEPHSEDHETILERVLVGDLSPSSGEVRQLLSRCSVCSTRLTQLQGLAAQLDGAGEFEREGVAEAARGELTPQAERRVRDFVQERARSHPGRRTWLAWAGFAAAASIAAVLLYRQQAPGDPGPGNGGEVMLGSKDVIPKHPREAVDSFLPFQWSAAEVEPGGYFTLTIWNEDVPDSDPFVVRYIPQARWDGTAETGGVFDEPRAKTLFGADGNGRASKIRWQVEKFGTQTSPTGRSKVQSAHLD